MSRRRFRISRLCLVVCRLMRGPPAPNSMGTPLAFRLERDPARAHTGILTGWMSAAGDAVPLGSNASCPPPGASNCEMFNSKGGAHELGLALGNGPSFLSPHEKKGKEKVGAAAVATSASAENRSWSVSGPGGGGKRGWASPPAQRKVESSHLLPSDSGERGRGREGKREASPPA